MSDIFSPQAAVDIIRKHCPNFSPKLGIILGSGLASVVNAISNPISISYRDIPGFPQSQILGHKGHLHLGYIKQTPVVCFQGRTHRYEGQVYPALKCMIRSLKLLGCESLFVTNAVGSLRSEWAPSELVAITDHINFSFDNPLVGDNESEFGERFLNMEEAYDPTLRKLLQQQAIHHNISLHEGVYLGALGPSFETPAEIRAFRLLGADIVGMSTIPDVIIARHCQLKVVAVSVIANFAAGMSPEKITHELTLKQGAKGAESLAELLVAFAGAYK
jgi:xanthosine phosphorylase